MTEHAGSRVGQVRLLRIERLYVRRGLENELTDRLERSIRALRERHEAFHSHLAHTYGEDGTCEIVVVLVWQPPTGEGDVMRGSAFLFDRADYAEMVEGRTGCTYELVQPELDDLTR